MGIETLAIAGLALSAVGTGAGVMGQIQSANAQKASADYQAQVARGNQDIALKNAQFASASGEAQAAIQEQKTRAQEGSILAAEGSSGVDINSETSSSVRTSQGELGALDAQTIRANAARQAYGFTTQATNFGNSASADTSAGKNDETAGFWNAGGGLLSGAGNASMNYANVMGKATGLGTQDYSSPIGPTFSGSAMGVEL